MLSRQLRSHRACSIIVHWICFLLGGILTTASLAAEGIRYNRDIRPILSSKCFQCHGFDANSREADLRLDLEDASRAAIEPGEPEASELMLRLMSDDPNVVMPPPEIEKPVTDEERELIRRWIEQDAAYEDHWVYEPLQDVTPPTRVSSIGTQTMETDANPKVIDAFLNRRWARDGLTPAPKASPRDLMRRLSFDLRGLPPTADDVAAFEADPSRKHFQTFVDQWLDSIEYAENQSQRWLDLVRFADTSGLVSDEPIDTGLYRRWIVQSFDRNQPFDEFTIEQIAGDLLDHPTDDQLIASAYNRLVKTNCEAGVIDQEALYQLKGEHVRGIGTVWLSATTGCAECHDHKFDPISAKDYYALAAFFDDLVEVGVYTPGDRRVPLHFVHANDQDRKRDQALVKQLNDLQQQLDSVEVGDVELEAFRQTQLEALNDKSTRDSFVWIDAHHTTAMLHGGSPTLETLDDNPARVTSAEPNQFASHHMAELATGFFNAASYEKPDPDGSFFVDVWLDPNERPRAVVVQMISGAYGRMGWKPREFRTFFWGDANHADALASQLPPAQSIECLGELPETSGWIRQSIPLGKLKFTYDLCGMRWAHVGGRVGWGDCGLDTLRSIATERRLAEFPNRRWWNQPHYRMTFQDRMKLMPKIVRGTASQDPSLQQTLLRDALVASRDAQTINDLRELDAELHRIRGQAEITLVSQAGPPKTTRVLNRGNFMDESGPIVEPAIPEFLGKLATGERRANRLDLARWLVSDDNPITPRVFVNRAWQQFYGRGISASLDDSGGQGAWPTHPELLDWLAMEFRNSGWDRKELTRWLVSTEAYQLASMPTDDLKRDDPANETFARQARCRLTGEQIRDTALAAAGLLQRTETIPRDSFFPYQPDEYWQRSCKIMYGSRHMIWETSPGVQQHQRSLYAFWKRQNIHPTMLAMDAPTRQECTPIRRTTNTPAQALTLLNDPVFLDAAIGLAERVLGDDSTSGNVGDDGRLGKLFACALQRPPSQAERETLLELLTQQRRHYRAAPNDAAKLLALHPEWMEAPSSDACETAAWTLLARVLLNTHEFVTRP